MARRCHDRQTIQLDSNNLEVWQGNVRKYGKEMYASTGQVWDTGKAYGMFKTLVIQLTSNYTGPSDKANHSCENLF